MALFAAVETFTKEAQENRQLREASENLTDSAKDNPSSEDQRAGSIPSVERTGDGTDEAGDGASPSAIDILITKVAEADLPERALINVIVSWAKISSEKSRSGLMLESLLLSAVAQFEVFVSRLITASLRFDPAGLSESDTKYTFGDVAAFSTLDSFTNAAADTFVDSLMHSGMAGWMKFLARATRSDTAWVSDLLAEVVMRRNVHVHAGGKASAQYLASLGKNAAAVQVGDDLPVTEAYLEDSLNRMARAAIVLSQSGIAAVYGANRGKLLPEDLGQDTGVVDASFDLLSAGRFQAVAPLAEQLEAFVSKNSTKERLRVNSMWAQKKWLGDDNVRSEVEAWDVSSSEDELKLAKHCLLGEKDIALSLYRRLAEAKKLTVMELATWPVLETVRTAIAEETAAE